MQHNFRIMYIRRSTVCSSLVIEFASDSSNCDFRHARCRISSRSVSSAVEFMAFSSFILKLHVSEKQDKLLQESNRIHVFFAVNVPFMSSGIVYDARPQKYTCTEYLSLAVLFYTSIKMLQDLSLESLFEKTIVFWKGKKYNVYYFSLSITLNMTVAKISSSEKNTGQNKSNASRNSRDSWSKKIAIHYSILSSSFEREVRRTFLVRTKRKWNRTDATGLFIPSKTDKDTEFNGKRKLGCKKKKRKKTQEENRIESRRRMKELNENRIAFPCFFVSGTTRFFIRCFASHCLCSSSVVFIQNQDTLSLSFCNSCMTTHWPDKTSDWISLPLPSKNEVSQGIPIKQEDNKTSASKRRKEWPNASHDFRIEESSSLESHASEHEPSSCSSMERTCHLRFYFFSLSSSFVFNEALCLFSTWSGSLRISFFVFFIHSFSRWWSSCAFLFFHSNP